MLCDHDDISAIINVYQTFLSDTQVNSGEITIMLGTRFPLNWFDSSITGSGTSRHDTRNIPNFIYHSYGKVTDRQNSNDAMRIIRSRWLVERRPIPKSRENFKFSVDDFMLSIERTNSIVTENVP